MPGHTACLWQGTKLLVFGGENEHRQHLADVIVFDLKTAHWTQPELHGPMPRGRARHSAVIYDDKLYITEGTVPAGYPEPGLFQQSLGFIDANGNGIRYDSHYVNGQPVPTVNGGQIRTEPGAGGARPVSVRGRGRGGAGRGGQNTPPQ